MDGITIKKVTATRFELTGSDIGKITNIEKRWTEDDNIHFMKPNGSSFYEHYKKVRIIDLGETEITPFNNLKGCLTILDDIGFANFKTGEAAPDLSLYQPENRGVFAGVFHLDRYADDFYEPLVQTASLPLSIGPDAIVGGIAKVKLTANGNPITGFDTWIRQSSDDITTTNGAVMDLIVQKTATEIHYSVKIR